MFNLKGYAFCPRPILAPFGYQKLTFAPPFWCPGQPFGHSRAYSGGQWKKQEGHEIFIDFGSILGLCFDVVWALRLEI